MFKALIIDDEFPAQEGLKKLIHHSKPELFKEIFVASSVNEGVEIIREHAPSLVFLDINMPSEYGFKLFDYFDKIHFEVIFTTAHSDYIMDAINNWGCLGYLMKPISILELKNVLHRFEEKQISMSDDKIELVEDQDNDQNQSLAIRNAINQENGVLVFTSVNEMIFIKIDEIIYCKASDNYCEIKTINKLYTVSKPLKEVEKMIDRNAFIRVHRSYLVHVKFAVRLDKKSNTLVLLDECNSEEILIPVTASGLKILNNVAS